MTNHSMTFARMASAGVLGALFLAGSAALAAQQIAVPSYFDTSNAGWTTMQQNTPTVGLAVINPSNGIGSDSEFQGYASLVANKPANFKILGYVYTRYATTTVIGSDPDRSVAGIEANIERYYTLDPGISGIFLDEATNDCGTHEAYYASLRAYMTSHHAGATLVINPGAPIPQCYYNDADIIVTFEGHFSSYSNTNLNVTDDPGGRTGSLNSNSSKFWHLVYDTPSGSLANALDWSRQNYAGSVYATQLNDPPNPWDALASYFSTEVANVQASGGGGPYAVTINALDLDHGNAQISPGMCVFIDGSSQCAWTPVNTSLAAGAHTINMTNYQNIVFNHWDNGSTSASRSVTLSSGTTFNAYFHTL